LETFRNLGFAFEALKKSGNMPCILNAANEVAVDAFLKDKVGFLEMSDIIEFCMQTVNFIEKPTVEDYIETDKSTREAALTKISKS
jgi:1-deoxy-D-xylulose-5-phosphate reductoisomerase